MCVEKIRRDIVFGRSRVKDYVYRACLLFGGFSFFIEGIKSRGFFSEYGFVSEMQFFPQGFRLSFYGILFFLYGFYLFLIRFLSVGSGFNEYDKEKKLITVFRLWYPGKNRRVIKQYSFSRLKSIVLESKKQIFDPRDFDVYLNLDKNQRISLIEIGRQNGFLQQREQEYFFIELAEFLDVFFERRRNEFSL